MVDFNQSLALQAGAIAALEQAPDWPARLCTTYRERRDSMLAALAAEGWPVQTPSMALYLWLALPEAAAEQGLNAEAACAQLLERSGVCLTPGSGFGAGGEGWARLALVHPSSELVAGAKRMGSWLKQL